MTKELHHANLEGAPKALGHTPDQETIKQRVAELKNAAGSSGYLAASGISQYKNIDHPLEQPKPEAKITLAKDQITQAQPSKLLTTTFNT